MKGHDRIRSEIAQEAARLMYEEGVREYRDAKRKAAKHLGADHVLRLGTHLPSNAEIHRELQRLLLLHDEHLLPERVLRLRLLALKYLEMLRPFKPYLVGSVLSGVVTEQSDIDLHLFADDPEEVEIFFSQRGLDYELEVVTVRKNSEFRDYPHIYLEEAGVEIECSIYPLAERHQVTKSSITGRPMERANEKSLNRIIGESLGG